MAAPKGNNYGRKWKKGQSGNPSGRSKSDLEWQALCKDKAPSALEVIEKIAHDPHHPKQLDAAKWICEQGHGSANRRVTLSGDEQNPVAFQGFKFTPDFSD